MASPRVLIAGMHEEVATFNPAPTVYDDFRVYRGAEIATELRATDTFIGGGISALEQAGDVELVPAAYAITDPARGPVVDADLDRLIAELLDAVRGCGAVDGVFLDLHGAMAGESEGDPEGRLVAGIRALVGPVPMVAAMDLHAVVTERLLASLDAISFLHTYPHTDWRPTAARAVANLRRLLAGAVRPTTARIQLPMLVRGDQLITATGLFGQAIRECQRIEAAEWGVAAAVNIGNPFTDVPDLASNVIVTTNGDQERADREALQIARFMWHHRHDMQATLTPLATAISEAEHTPGLTVFSDGADATSSGAPGDSNAILRGLIEAGYRKRALMPLVDAPAVASATQAGVGASLQIPLGGAVDRQRHTPLPLTVRVERLSDGRFVDEGERVGEGGATAVLAVAQHRLLVTERPVSTVGRRVFQAQGLEPTDFDLIVCKSPNGFRTVYEPLAALIVAVDVPGATSANLPSLPFQRVRRPMFPLDLDAEPPFALTDESPPPRGR